MSELTFITGNQSKADYLAKYLDHPVAHQKLDLDEIQSLDLRTVVEHKVRQAYDLVHKPVLVDDVALEFKAWGRLPGTFIRFYVDEVPFETMCRSLDGFTREATARAMFGYYDGLEVRYFEGSLPGTTAEHPAGSNGYGWDKLFISQGHSVTRASLNDNEYQKSYSALRPIAALKTFLEQR